MIALWLETVSFVTNPRGGAAQGAQLRLAPVGTTTVTVSLLPQRCIHNRRPG